MEEDDPVEEEEVEAEGSEDNIVMEEATAAINKGKHKKEAAMEVAKAAEDQVAEIKEKDSERMAVLLSQQGQRENKEAAVDLTEPGEEKDGAEEGEDDAGLQDSVLAKKMNPTNTAQRKKKQTSMARIIRTTQRCCTSNQGDPSEQPLSKSSETP